MMDNPVAIPLSDISTRRTGQSLVEAATSAPTPTMVLASSPEEAEKRRWLHMGYRKAAEHMASDNDFFVVRRFATANTRAILFKQARIFQLEKELERLDRPTKCSDQGGFFDNSTVLKDPKPERGRKLEQLWNELKDYSKRSPTMSDTGSPNYLICLKMSSLYIIHN